MKYIFSLLFFLTPILSQNINCPIDNIVNNRSIYSVGDTLSLEDQNMQYPVCNGSGDYSTGDSFSFSDLNGKITLISMNATW